MKVQAVFITRVFPFSGDPFLLCKPFFTQEYVTFLDSCGRGEKSYLALYPQRKFWLKNNVLYTEENHGQIHAERCEDGFSALDGFIRKLGDREKLFGYLAYPLVQHIEKISITGTHVFPDLFFFVPSVVITFDHATGNATVAGEKRFVEDVVRSLLDASKCSTSQSKFQDAPCGMITGVVRNVRSNFSKEKYVEAVLKAKEYVLAGDSFQIKLSQRFSFDVDDAFESLYVYERLRTLNPSPYSVFARFGSFEVLSCSPEHLVSRRGTVVNTTPIGGTYPYRTGERDEEILKAFFSDAKEVAEHAMLIDLERNDLGKVCVPGSVHVADFMRIEKYSHLTHIVTNIVGTLEPQKGTVDLLKAMFPGGTVTGCPKIRTMEIIDELEQMNRSLYTGSLGWIDALGDCSLNILIRTLVLDRKMKKGFVQVGGGVVADSNPEREYEETLWKAQALFESLGVKL